MFPAVRSVAEALVPGLFVQGFGVVGRRPGHGRLPAQQATGNLDEHGLFPCTARHRYSVVLLAHASLNRPGFDRDLRLWL